MRCLVTGGLGFIGHRLCRALLVAGHPVRVLDNQQASCVAPEALAGEGAEVVAGDVTRLDDCRRAAAGVDVIVHLAAQTNIQVSLRDPAHDLAVNAGGTLTLLDAARAERVSRFVFASTNAVFGPQSPPLHEDLVPRPISPYGISKLAGEGYCRAYHEQCGIKTTSLRFANVYGPGSDLKSSAVATMMRAVLEGRALEIHGDGAQTRDFTHVDDIVQAIVLALGAEGAGEVFAIGTGVETSVARLVETLTDVVRSDGGPEIRVEQRPARGGDVRRNYSSIARAQAMLGYRPRVELKAGVAETWAWFRKGEGR
jgi:UDP-glucose 4-epimerase